VSAAAALRAARASYRGGDAAACRRQLAAGLAAAAPGSVVEARLRALEVRLLLWDRAALDEARAALALARRAGAPRWEAQLALGTALFMVGDRASLRHLDLAVAEAPTIADRAEAGLLAGAALHSLGELRKARRRFAHAREEASRARRRDLVALARYGDAHAAMMVDADYAYAISELQAARREPVGMLADELRSNLAIALADAGDDAGARAVLDEGGGLAEVAWGRSALLYARTEAEWAAGRLERAIAVAEECAATGVPHLAEPALMTRGWARSELGLDPDLPASWSLASPVLASYDAEAAGLRALAGGRYADAHAALLDAARIARRTWIRNELRALLGAARAAELDGAHDEAERLRVVVGRRARTLGIQSIARRVDAVERPAPRIVLTPRLRQVIELVAQGLTSEHIAQRLGLSRATIESHVQRLMKDVGARTRLEAAARVLPAAPPAPALPADQQRVIDLLATGATVTEAAALLHVSRRTLTRRLGSIRRRLGASSNAELVAQHRPR
jgi:DNA-binding NarL/FixJ family response regulator